jgi:hypothetical protein
VPGWPAGYPSRGEWHFRNVTQDVPFWPLLDSISISQTHPDGIAVLSCTVRDPSGTDFDFDDDDEVRVTFRGERIWAGNVRARTRTQMTDRAGPRTWELVGQDYTARLDDDVIGSDTEQPRESITARVTWILSHLGNFPGMTTDNVDLPAEQVEPASYGGMTVREALDSVADEMDLHYYVDFTKDLHMFRSEVIDAPFGLDDDAPDYSTTFPYSDFRRERDTMELTNAVKVIGRRHTRTVTDDASIAAYGRQESIIVDDSLRTLEQVLAAGRRRLNQLAEPIEDGGLTCWEPGIQAGMRIAVVNAMWSIDTNFIVTGVEMTAVDPHDDADEALLRTEVRFTDRRRTGRFPGAGRNRKADKKGAEASVATSTGTCCDPVPTDDEPLNEFGGDATGPPTSLGSASSAEVSFSEGTTQVEVALPTGSAVAGRFLVMCLAWDQAGALDVAAVLAALDEPWEAVGSPATSGDVASQWFYRRLDGTEPYASVGLVFDLDPGTETSVDVAAVVELLDDVHADDDVDADDAASADPPSLAQSGGYGAGDHVRHYAAVLTDGGAVTSGPGGAYSSIGEDAGVGLVLRADAADGTNDAEDPDAFTASGALTAWTVRVRGAASAGFGSIAPGPTWEGGNEFQDASPDAPDWAVVGDDLVVTSDEAGKVLTYYAAGAPDLPSSLDDWTISVDFTIEEAGIPSDPGLRYLGVGVVVAGRHVSFEARLGDDDFAEGVAIRGDSVDFAAEAMAGEMRLKGMFDGESLHAKLWPVGDPEPGWMVTLPLEDWSTDGTYGEDVIEVTVALGNDGPPAQVLTVSPLVIGGGAQHGEAVAWHSVGRGDGVTVTFDTRYAYVPTTLQVRVDGQSVVPASKDGPGAAFTLDGPPYGDPEDPLASALVEARYTRS